MVPDVSPENPAILVCDGHSSHMTLELLLEAKRIGVHIVHRPPHTSHRSQPEDVGAFRYLKPQWYAAKDRLLMSRLSAKNGYNTATRKSPGERAKLPNAGLNLGCAIFFFFFFD